MKIACFQYQDQISIGQVSANGQEMTPFILSADQQALVATQGVQLIVELQSQGLPLPAQAKPIAMKDICLLAPIPRPRRNVFCVGKNYLDHVKEVQASKLGEAQGAMANLPKHPVVFSKVPESVVGPQAGIQNHAGVTQELDYEAELAIVIGRQGRAIRASDALDYVWGYTIINDISARDLQAKHVQFHIGKSLDTACPMGPYLVSKDELNAQKTQVKCWVNDELRQDASTELMIFDIPTIIANLSAGMTLYPGDVIATGTPSGVGVGFKPPRFLKKGDRIKIEIDGVGVLENPVV